MGKRDLVAGDRLVLGPLIPGGSSRATEYSAAPPTAAAATAPMTASPPCALAYGEAISPGVRGPHGGNATVSQKYATRITSRLVVELGYLISPRAGQVR